MASEQGRRPDAGSPLSQSADGWSPGPDSWHFQPPFGWMNDPNGLVWFEGEYHLFYQFHPFSMVWGPMHWGHAVSADLVNWEDLPIALAPDSLGAIFSGSAVADADNASGLVPGGGLAAIFTQHRESPEAGQEQTQGMAFSTDRGRNWTKYSGNPVLSAPDPALARDFRDPKVFRHGDGWAMVLAAGDHLEFYRSANLRDWELTGRFDARLTAGVWECPDLFQLDGPGGRRWILLLSVGDLGVAGGSGTMYFIGDYDGRSFVASGGPEWLDHGPDNYAGVTWNGLPDGQRILIAWMNNWRYARAIPATGRRGAMTMPRRLSLSDDPVPVLVQQPVFDPGPGRSMSLALESDGAGCRGLRLHFGSASVVELTWDCRAGTLTLDRSRAGQVDFHPDFGRSFTVALKRPGASLDLLILRDRNSVEVFAEGGRTVMTALVFPADADEGRAKSAMDLSCRPWPEPGSHR